MMAVRIIHLCMDVQGFLMHHNRKKDYEKMFRDNSGRILSSDEARHHLLNELAAGHRVIPMTGCDNFDFQKGCLGHNDNT